MPKLSFSFLLLVLLFTTTAKKCNDKMEWTNILNRTWLHSHEEDLYSKNDNIKTYRPEGFSFPPARGRVGFKIMDNERFIEIGIAPADGRKLSEGKWELVGDKTILVTFGNTPAYKLTVVSFKDDILKIEKQLAE